MVIQRDPLFSKNNEAYLNSMVNHHFQEVLLHFGKEGGIFSAYKGRKALKDAQLCQAFKDDEGAFGLPNFAVWDGGEILFLTWDGARLDLRNLNGNTENPDLNEHMQRYTKSADSIFDTKTFDLVFGVQSGRRKNGRKSTAGSTKDSKKGLQVKNRSVDKCGGVLPEEVKAVFDLNIQMSMSGIAEDFGGGNTILDSEATVLVDGVNKIDEDKVIVTGGLPKLRDGSRYVYDELKKGEVKVEEGSLVVYNPLVKKRILDGIDWGQMLWLRVGMNNVGCLMIVGSRQ